MGLVIWIIVIIVLVLGLGLLIVTLMRRSQRVVPDVADREAAKRERVVAIDDQGQPVTASQEGDEAAPTDDAAFEAVLNEELEDLGR